MLFNPSIWEKIAPIDIHRLLLDVYGDQTMDVSTVRRPHRCYLAYGNKTYGILEGRFNLYCHTTASDVVDQHNKIGGISFGATLV